MSKSLVVKVMFCSIETNVAVLSWRGRFKNYGLPSAEMLEFVINIYKEVFLWRMYVTFLTTLHPMSCCFSRQGKNCKLWSVLGSGTVW